MVFGKELAPPCFAFLIGLSFWPLMRLTRMESPIFQEDPRLASLPGSASPCGLYEFFVNHNEGPGIHKWVHYFPVYEEHLGRFCTGTADIRMLEIGIQSGGSLLMWQKAFGEKLKLLVGMDINPKTKAWERFGSNVKVEIGSQANVQRLQSIKGKYPEGFDIILDDGSHVPEHIFVTFVEMWPAIRPGGSYIIEDVHGTAPVLDWMLHGHRLNSKIDMAGLYWPGKKMGPGTAISLESGDFMNHFGNMKNFSSSKTQREVESIKIYPYLIVITRRQTPMMTLHAEKRGTEWIPRP
ncbi:tylE [Symbiodinium sp. CCMP2592]|nr:tylE [Symbiodinium sp. CCMP2592]